MSEGSLFQLSWEDTPRRGGRKPN